MIGIRRRAVVRRTAVAEIMTRLSEIIGAAHTLPSPVVHRDLKPANVLVQRAADRALQLKVTDFGIGAIAANRAIKEGEAAVKAGVVPHRVGHGNLHAAVRFTATEERIPG